jgi:hypothetical protein
VSEYSETADSDDDSLDAMSLVSSSEIKGLVADQQDFEDDGYDTETTDNTSPSHNKRKPSRKSVPQLKIELQISIPLQTVLTQARRLNLKKALASILNLLLLPTLCPIQIQPAKAMGRRPLDVYVLTS